mmetsp:Transcript_3151/g.13662  ORF Transcript_3151/g.13662 Transcript_3151/m.13662 type:complete len:4229 (-) Transcript_3151:2367-15053(-)
MAPNGEDMPPAGLGHTGRTQAEDGVGRASLTRDALANQLYLKTKPPSGTAFRPSQTMGRTSALKSTGRIEPLTAARPPAVSAPAMGTAGRTNAMGANAASYETTVRSSTPARVGGAVTLAPLTPTGDSSRANGSLGTTDAVPTGSLRMSPSKPLLRPESEDDGYQYLTLLRWMCRNAADEERRRANALPPGPHGADEFVYLARLDRDPNDWQPYALGVREYHGLDRTDYYTMSAQGITHFLDGAQPEFITAERWELEVANYKKIKSLTVFRTYKKWKSWKLWRKSVMSAKMQRAASVLEKNLFVLDPVFAPTIDKVRDACRELSKKRLSKVRTGEVRTLGAFVDEVKEAREEMTEEFARFSAEQTATVSDACQRSLDAMEARLEEFYGNDLPCTDRVDRVSGHGSAGPSSPAAGRISATGSKLGSKRGPGSEDAAQYAYTVAATRRTEQRRCLTFVKLMDYVMCDTMHDMLLDSVNDVLSATKQCEEDQFEMPKPPHRLHKPRLKVQSAMKRMFRKITQENRRQSASKKVREAAKENQLMDTIKDRQMQARHEKEDDELNRFEPKFPVLPQFEVELAWDERASQTVFEPSFHDFQSEVEKTVKSFIDMLAKVKRLPDNKALMSKMTDALEMEQSSGKGMDMADLAYTERWRELVRQVRRSLAFGFDTATRYKDNFDIFVNMKKKNAETSTSQIVENYKSGDLVIDNFRRDTITYLDQKKRMEAFYVDQNVGIVKIKSQRLQTALLPSPTAKLEELSQMLPGLAAEMFNKCIEEVHAGTNKLANPPKSAEDFTDVMRFCVDLRESTLERLGVQAEEVKALYDLINEFGFPIKEEDQAKFALLEDDFAMLETVLDESEGQQEDRIKQFAAEMIEAGKEVNQNLKDLAKAATDEMILDVEAPREQVLEFVEDLTAKVEAQQAEAKRIVKIQETFKVEPTEFESLKAVAEDVALKRSMWVSDKEFDGLVVTWAESVFDQIDVAFMEEKVQKMGKLCVKLERGLQPNSVVPAFKAKVDAYKQLLPVISALGNDALLMRHWEKIQEIIGQPIVRDETFTLQKILDMKCPDHSDAISQVSVEATQERQLESQLEKIVKRWQDVSFAVTNYKESKDTFILGGLEEVFTALEDSMVTMTTILSSRFVAGIRTEVEKVEKNMNVFSDTLDEWLAVQKNWMYLESIFSAPDIQRQLPNESKQFYGVDKMYRDVMRKTRENDNAMRAATTPGYLEKFQKANETLDFIQKNLEEYLETKRMGFPRFYFLSNDELLEILAETKNVQAVQPHMSKCFDGIKSLDFGEDPKSVDIFAMFSAEGERVQLGKNLKARGNVEQWLTAVEAAMVAALKKQGKESYVSYAKEARTDWVRNQPAQIVIMVAQIYWCRGVIECLESENPVAAMEKYLEKNRSDLKDMTAVVREDLTRLHRKIIAALITIDVHARDIVEELWQEKVESVNDFKWQMQLRYYWDDKDDICLIRQTNTLFNYAYEYLGAQSRLVVTPMTDRCYMTLTGAMHLRLGGAPAGPAGTGKTETTKDLAKALARQCVVFNCSDSMDYIQMGKFFKGLASSGAWACFDEFNRIDLEVLSVVAQQVLDIQRAIAARVTSFIFEGTEIGLKYSAWCSITMNPGYAGRSELPDNLKALFRTVAMMVPDYAMIGEIILYSFGYLEARDMARKLVQTYRLCSEQLSSQDHYDYGMRAVIAVLRAAGNLKRKFVDEAEDVLMLRALTDVNLPKFLDQDVPLFRGILSDLFPGVKLPEIDYDNLNDALRNASAKAKLQPLDTFFEKIIQLYEMIIVRHGLMLVGESYGMKSSCISVLADALGELNDKGLNGEQKVKYYCLNPKSITMGQLYGAEDPVSKEWADGILAVTFRNAARDTSPDRKWVVFDGPVDAIWIENMNTVLDDNKKLCLNSGEIVAMQGLMNMIFEVQDLAVASPATVSRCGMIYMEPTTMGLTPLLDSYLQSLPDLFQPHVDKFREIFEAVVPGMEGIVFFMRKNLKETVTTVDTCLVKGQFNLMASLLKRYVRDPMKGEEPLSGEERRNADKAAVPLWIFSMIWSLCASVTGPGRPQLEQFFRKKAEEHEFANFMPPEGKGDASMYEYCYDQDKCKWVEWMQTIPEYKPNPDQAFASIIVPTADTVRYTYVIDKLLLNDKHVLCVGDTGTGKTLNVMDKLNNNMSDLYVPMFMTFSARTSANQTQDFLDSKMDKRRKGVFGPPMGKKYAILIDDFNMPMREKYFAQPPIELLRQWMDHGGWYERHPPCPFRTLQDMIIVGCMGPPGGGRNPVSNRMLRHFNFLSFTDMSDESSIRIFDTILKSYLTKKFDKDVAALSLPICEATVNIYNTVRRDLLPTPAKSHYTFNLRDLARVFQGLLRADPRVVAEDRNELYGLWMHENLRVFQDRMVNNEDREWFRNLIDATAKEKLGVGWDEVVSLPEPKRPPEEADNDDWVPPPRVDRLIYGDYMIPGAEPRVYQRVKDRSELQRVVEEALDDYNGETTAPMKLVMFLDAIEHVSRICRVIRLPLGNALLLGVGGSGRQSLTRLAAALEEFHLFSIEVAKGYGKNEWRDDLRKVLLMAGAEGKDVVFLFTDTQIVQENFLEDINNILNSGEVPGLFAQDEKERMMTEIRPYAESLGLNPTKDVLFSTFINRVRDNLHIILCMSPVGEAFRSRCRQFPSLINCCTIDWFMEWPEEALTSVSNKFLSTVDLGSPEVNKHVANMCVDVHMSVTQTSERFFQELRRKFYTTPKSYLDLINLYTALLAEKREELGNAKDRLLNGLNKLAETNVIIDNLKIELGELQPVLEEKSAATADLIEQVNKDKADAAEVEKKVIEEEAQAKALAAETEAIAASAKADLEEAMPALDAAVESLNALNKNDIVEIKNLPRPPPLVGVTMEAVLTLLKEKTDWASARKVLGDTGFMKRLFEFDKDNISPKTLKRLEKFVNREDFTPEIVQSQSQAAKSLCMWCRAMHVYAGVEKVVRPKRKALAEAEASLAATLAALKEKQQFLKDVQDKVAQLEKDLAKAEAESQSLKDQAQLTEDRLVRAEKLTSGLADEAVRWKSTAESLGDQRELLVGDVFVSAACVSYFGAFNGAYRDELVDLWTSRCRELGVPVSENCSLKNTLASPVEIREWNIWGLPTDDVSVDNGILVTRGRRWPLMIDPQAQANTWVKNMEQKNALKIIKLTDGNYLRTMENSIRNGTPVLVEDIGETLDPALEPILQKAVFVQNGRTLIRLGDTDVDYDPNFKFYLTTKMPNPHYLPEVCIKVTIINFTVTIKGLEDQLLGDVVRKERPDLEEAKDRLVLSISNDKKQLKDLEDKILRLLKESEGNILDDVDLIKTLETSKTTSTMINGRVKEAEQTEASINETREKYRPAAIRGSILYFVVADLALIGPMYQYSLNFFMKLFNQCIDNSEPSERLRKRLKNLMSYTTYFVYVSVCRGLFEEHKLLFSLLVCTSIMRVMTVQEKIDEANVGDAEESDEEDEDEDAKPEDAAPVESPAVIEAREWNVFLRGTPLNYEAPAKTVEWLTDAVWRNVCYLETDLPNYLTGFTADMAAKSAEFEAWADSDSPFQEPMPGGWDDKLTYFIKLAVVKVFKEDKAVASAQQYIGAELGKAFTEAPPWTLDDVFPDTNSRVPIIFILSTGADPTAMLQRFATKMGWVPGERLHFCSLGQGQGPIAEEMVSKAQDNGDWVCLQNCHVASSWMLSLEAMVNNMSQDYNPVHDDFRLWLTSYPSPIFPITILENSVKMTNEAPKGLRAGLMRTFMSDPLSDSEFFDTCTKDESWRKMVFGLAFFHSSMQERRKYGAIGFNIPYDFNENDLRISIRQLKMFLDEYPEVPYETLMYTCGECNYGGKVTDGHDRVTVDCILRLFYTPDILQDGYAFSPSGLYKAPPHGNYKSYLKYINTLPLIAAPEVYGFHANADIQKNMNETDALLASFMMTQSREGSGGGKSPEEVIGEVAESLLAKLPPNFDVEMAEKKYPVDYYESMNTVLTQELGRVNTLLSLIRNSLVNLGKAVKGQVLMSDELDRVGKALYDGKVPASWLKKSFPSLKPLGSYMKEVIERAAFFKSWVDDGIPSTFPLYAFFFTQAFLTGSKQNFARSHKIEIDKVDFDYAVLDGDESTYTEKPADGVYCFGMHIDGAAWDPVRRSLCESEPKVLYAPCPGIHMIPARVEDFKEYNHYKAPLYKTADRRGILSTTGHSTNFVMDIRVPCEQDGSHWIRRGTALLLSLKD